MYALSATTSMKEWFTSEWTLTTSHAIGQVEAPPSPPSITSELLQEWHDRVNHALSEYEFDDEEAQEHIVDMAIAEDALATYLANGVTGTRRYSEYRANRLDSTS